MANRSATTSSKKPKSAFDSFRGLKKIQQVSLMVAGLIIVGTAFIGVYNFSQSSAARPGAATVAVNAIGFSPNSGKYSAGSLLTVTIQANSGSEPVNAVQAHVNYDSARLTLRNVEEAGAYDQAAATDTSIPGIVRVARGVTGTPLTGIQPVVKLHFIVNRGVSGGASLSFDPGSSYLVSESTATNILTSTTAATFNIRLK